MELWAGYQRPTLLPCKQALGVWFHGPWRMDVQPLFQKCFDSGLQYICVIWTQKKMERNKLVRRSAPTSVASGPAGGAATHSLQLPPRR